MKRTSTPKRTSTTRRIPTTDRERRRQDVFRLLGLAQRAGAVVRGTDAVRQLARAGKARLVLTAVDGSPGQLGKVEGLLRNRNVPRRRLGTRSEIGAALGAPPLTAVALTDEGFASEMLHRLDLPGDAGE